MAKCRNHVFGMAFDCAVGRNAVDTPPEERQRAFEEHWTGSFRWVFETFDDLLVDPVASRLASEFIVAKMKERVRDPKVAELLSPSFADYPLFAQRPPLDHGYPEAYNRDNVRLVDMGALGQPVSVSHQTASTASLAAPTVLRAESERCQARERAPFPTSELYRQTGLGEDHRRIAILR